MGRAAGLGSSWFSRALRVRNYRLFASGAIVSNVGIWMQRIAQDWLVLDLTGSGTLVAMATAAQFLPMLLLTPLAGVVADRHDKRALLRVTQTAMAVPALVLGVLAIAQIVQLWQVMVLAFLLGVGAAFDTPARHAFAAEVVPPEHVSNAVGLNAASYNSARIIGPAVAGGVIAVLGDGTQATGIVILVNGISYFAMILALSLMRPEELHDPPPVDRTRGMIRAAARVVWRIPHLRRVFGLVAISGTLHASFQLATLLMITDTFGRGAGEFGTLSSAAAFGALGGALWTAQRSTVTIRLLVFASLALGLVWCVGAVAPTFTVFMILAPVIGFASLATVTAANTLVQLLVPGEMRARVTALYLTVHLGVSAVGSTALGAVADVAGPRWLMATAGLVLSIAAGAAALLHARSQRDASQPGAVR